MRTHIWKTVAVLLCNAGILSGQTGNVGIGTNAPVARLHVKSGPVLFADTIDTESVPDPPPVQGPGNRLMWYPDMAAFRVGVVEDNSWNTDSIGLYSFAGGHSTKARGGAAMAFGQFTQALGNSASALGYLNAARGDFSTALGLGTRAGSQSSLAIGRYNLGTGTPMTWMDADPVFEIGIGSDAMNRANAMTVLKSGSAGIGIAQPKERLELSGALRLGSNVDQSPAAGTIRWNASTQDFEGFTGSQWRSLSNQIWGVPHYFSTETQSITVEPGEPFDVFGSSVGIWGEYCIAGAPGRDVAGINKGVSYIYHFDGTQWLVMDSIIASDGELNDGFGAAVSISGDYAVVGAPNNDVGGNVDQGRAYVFVRNGNDWTEQAILTASDGSTNYRFGNSVCIDGSYVIVGTAHPFDTGKAYVFHRTGTVWTEQEVLLASDGVTDDGFGISVSVSGDYAVVGAPYIMVGGNSSQGQAYVFVRSGSNWTEQDILVASDGVANANFGSAVSISGNLAVVGAPTQTVLGVSTGQSYVFRRNGSSWSEEARISASDGGSFDYFGIAVSLKAGYAVIGAHAKVQAYLFRDVGSSWTEETIFKASDGQAGSNFGQRVGLEENKVVVAAPEWVHNGLNLQGKIYIYER